MYQQNEQQKIEIDQLRNENEQQRATIEQMVNLTNYKYYLIWCCFLSPPQQVTSQLNRVTLGEISTAKRSKLRIVSHNVCRQYHS